MCLAESLAGEYNRQAAARGAKPGGNDSQALQAAPTGGGPGPDCPPEPCLRINLAEVEAATKPSAAKAIAYIVSLAKAETLDALGRRTETVEMVKAAYRII